jgi:hypothetical protein
MSVSALRVAVAVAVAVVSIGVSADAQARALPQDSLITARALARFIMLGQPDSTFRFMPDGAERLQEQVRRASAILAGEAGGEASLVEERWIWRHGLRQYWRIVNLNSPSPEPIAIRLVILPDGRFGGLGVGPISQAPAVDSTPPSSPPSQPAPDTSPDLTHQC